MLQHFAVKEMHSINPIRLCFPQAIISEQTQQSAEDAGNEKPPQDEVTATCYLQAEVHVAAMKP